MMRASLVASLCSILLLSGCDRRERQAQRTDTPRIEPLPVPDAPPRIAPRVPGDEEVPVLTGDAALAARLCRNPALALPASSTLFGHIKYDQAASGSLTGAPSGLGGGSCQQVHATAAAPLAAMLEAARAEAPAVGADLMAISCFRSIARQAALFCERGRIAERGYQGQARWVAPPGFSEHSTGLSVDFGSRNDGGCNLRPCFADTGVGRWLAANAGRFGFRLSFPPGNAQGVSYEPWHFRYVGGGMRSYSPVEEPVADDIAEAPPAPAPIEPPPPTPSEQSEAQQQP